MERGLELSLKGLRLPSSNSLSAVIAQLAAHGEDAVWIA